MLGRTSHRLPLLLALAVALLLAWAGKTPALAACAPGAADKPDLAFVDSNCDGIDGDRAAALFVAPGGSDANDGSFGHPKASVASAVTAALAAGRDVYVAAGTYGGKVAFLTANGNIGVYGGYDPQTWQRSAASVTTLQAPGQVVGVSIPGIVLQRLTVHSVSGPTYANSYGVRAFGAGTVALSRVTVQAAPGEKGGDGAVPPPQPLPAPSGDPGEASCNFFGGSGGLGSPMGLLNGGVGGAAWNQDQPWKGYDGKGDPGVEGGLGGQFPGQSGGQAAPGIAGVDGQGAAAALNHASSFYQAMPGSPGTNGTRGAGGGGGAAAPIDPCVTGSGGGAGGRPGQGGGGGKGGGGSIGVFAGAGAHVLVLDGSTIHTADGGHGGNGGAYQAGGAGGAGGPAIVHHYNGNTYTSGKGGDGGYGGHGGRGGGGAGGASIGVLGIDSLAVVAPDTTITVGSGGAGGIAGNDGKPGIAQKTAQVTTPGGSLPPVGDFDGDGVDDATDACPIAAGTGNGCPVAPLPPPAPTPTTQTSTTSTSTTQTSSTEARAFAGVRLASTRLTFDGRFIKVKLICPAGTSGRCTGGTRLTARPRRTSSRRVTLGRASFAIASGSRARVRVRVTRAGRRLLRSAPRRRGTAVAAARDGAGRSKTTRAAVTIRRRHR